MNQRNKSNPIRDAYIVNHCLAGESYRAIGRQLGISHQAVSSIVQRRLLPRLKQAEAKIVKEVARAQVKALGIRPAYQRPKTVEDIMAKPSPGAMAHAIMQAVGPKGAAEVAKRIQHVIAGRRYRARVKACNVLHAEGSLGVCLAPGVERGGLGG